MSLPKMISEHTGKLPLEVRLRGRERTVLFEARPFLDRLGSDRGLFDAVATVSLDIPNDSRSAVIPLANPFELSGITVRGLRFKGIYPAHDGAGAVLPYTAGAGYVPLIIEPSGENIITSRMERNDQEYSAQGTISYPRLKREAGTALALGSGITDVLLGAGLYPDLAFCGEPVGFAVYGMSVARDIRTESYFSDTRDAEDTVSSVSVKAFEMGVLLRQMHNAGFIHGYPHLDNIRMGADGLRLLDLDTAKPLSAFDGKRTAALYLDVARTGNDLIRNENLICRVEGDWIEVERPLFNNFLQGYFSGDGTPPMLRHGYGMLPSYGFRDGKGYRSHSLFSVLEPVISLYCSPPGQSVDLEQMFVENAPNEFYPNFYLALRQVAVSLGG